MEIRNKINGLWWGLPLITYSLDANAWGLFTHVYFAQSLLLATPLLNKRFKSSHQWQKATFLIDNATSHKELAIAIGYASHLYVDVIAHNHFVPAHEALWENDSILTHIAAEWAMFILEKG